MPAMAVLFDFYGTLARAVSYGLRFEDVFERWGLELDERFHDAWTVQTADGQAHFEYSKSRDTYRAWERQRLRAAVSACGVPTADVEGLVTDLHAASKDFTLKAYDEVPEVLAEFRQRGVIVAVCSNWDWDLDRALENAGLGGLAHVAVTSARVGARKPHPAIYQDTLARCRITPAEAVFVGDTWGPDVEGPLAAGMATAVHVWRDDAAHRGPPPALVPGSHRVTDLRGVLEAV